MFDVGKMYCKYVINTICNGINNLKINSKIYKELDDRLYESYLKLEEMMKKGFL